MAGMEPQQTPEPGDIVIDTRTDEEHRVSRVEGNTLWCAGWREVEPAISVWHRYDLPLWAVRVKRPMVYGHSLGSINGEEESWPKRCVEPPTRRQRHQRWLEDR